MLTVHLEGLEELADLHAKIAAIHVQFSQLETALNVLRSRHEGLVRDFADSVLKLNTALEGHVAEVTRRHAEMRQEMQDHREHTASWHSHLVGYINALPAAAHKMLSGAVAGVFGPR